MRKLISVLLVVLLLISAIACDPDSGTVNDVTFDVSVSPKRVVEAEKDSVAYVDKVEWKYSAVKSDDGYTTGETKEEKELGDGDLTLSLGYWTITVNGYSGENLTYTGTFKTEGAITADTEIAVEVKPVEDVKEGDIKFYGTLADALKDVADGGTVTLVKDVTLSTGTSQYFTTEKTFTLDLGGKTLKSDDIRIFVISKGTLTLKNGTVEGNLTANNSSVIRVDCRKGDAGIVVAKDAVVKAPKSYAVAAFGTTEYKGSIEVYGTIESANPCVTGQGHTDFAKNIVTIKIYDGAKLTKKSSESLQWKSNDDKVAVYQPNAGELYIYGGDISSEDGSAVEIRNGKAVITGGTFTSRASEYVDNRNGNGPTTKGAGIAVATYGNGNIDVTIEGVKFGEGTPAKFAVTNPNGVNIGESGTTVKVAVKGDFTVADFATISSDVTKAVVTLNGNTITIPTEKNE